MLKFYKIPTGEITIGLGGAVIRTGWMDEKRELHCAAAGPLTSVVLGLAFLRIKPELAIVSLLLAAVNLLPLYPLDGGRMLRAWLLLHSSGEKAIKIIRVTSLLVACGLMVLACWVTICLQSGIWPIFAALVLLWRAGDEEKQLLFLGTEDKMEEQE